MAERALADRFDLIHGHFATGSASIARYTSYLTGIPFTFTALCMLGWARSADKTGKRKLHAALPLAFAGVFLTLSAIPGQPFALVMTWLSLTGACAFSFATSFWTLPHMSLTATAAAAAIGLINLVGNLGGFVGPYANGSLMTKGYSDTMRIGLLSLSYLVAAILVAAFRVPRERQQL